MSVTTTHQRFARRLGTLWRDTGLHVLALPEEEAAEVVVLGGGSAVLWRLLAEPMTLADILDRLGAAADAPPEDVVTSCLADMAARGLIEDVAVERRG